MLSLAFATLASGHAQAQSAESALVEGPGIKVGEGTVLHPSVGADTGYISNLYYEEAGVRGAGLLRVIADFAIASRSAQRLEQVNSPDAEATSKGASGFQFRSGLNLAYHEYLSSTDAVQAQRNLAIGAGFHGQTDPMAAFTLALDDDFARRIRPTNYESGGDLDRYINAGRATVTYQPGGRALSAALRYENLFDMFESDKHSFANRMNHTIGLRGVWQWLPVTRLYLDASLGFYGGFGGDSQKTSSMPLRTLVGIQTALTMKTTLAARVGFGKGFYSAGQDFTNVVAGVEFGWRYSPFGRVLASYTYDFQDSIQANFYRDHAFVIQLDQHMDRLNLVGEVGFRLRGYRGIFTVIDGPAARDDVILNVGAVGRYRFSDTLAATLEYQLIADQTDYRYMSGAAFIDPSYVRHEAMVGIRAAF
jgi:hypothetical protein